MTGSRFSPAGQPGLPADGGPLSDTQRQRLYRSRRAAGHLFLLISVPGALASALVDDA